MRSLLSLSLGRKRTRMARPSSHVRRTHRPRVEPLEQRLLLSTTLDGNDFAGIGALDPSGNAYVLGSYHQSVDLDPGPGTSWTPAASDQPGQFLAKYGPDMTLQWAKTGSQLPPNFFVGGLAVYQDPSTSQTILYLNGGRGVAKYDTAGNLLQSWNTGILDHMVVGADGSVYGTASFSGTVDLDPDHVSPGDTLTSNGQDAYLAKWDSNGNFQWAQQIGGAGTEWMNGLAMQYGVLYVAGLFNGTLSPTGFTDAGVVGQPSSQDGYLLAYDSAGNFLAGDQFVDLSVTAPAADPTGVYLAGGFTYTDADADPGPGRFILPGNPAGANFACVIKLNLNADGTPGAFRWADTLGGSSTAGSITVYGGNVYLGGSFSSTIDFNPDPAVQDNLTPAGGNDAFAMELTSGGALVWVDQMGSSERYPVSPAAESAGFAVSGSGIYLGGYFAQGPATFGTVHLQGQGDEDGFVARLNSDGSTAWAFGIGSPIRTIDDGDAGYSETGTGWKAWTWKQGGSSYQGDARYHAAASGAETASWRFTALPDGTYQVLGRWPISSKNATNAPFTIVSGGSSTTVLKNQTLAGYDVSDALGVGWKSLGTIAVSGGTITVTLSDKANSTVMADVIRVVFLTPPGQAPAAPLTADTTSLVLSPRQAPMLLLSPSRILWPVTADQEPGRLALTGGADHRQAAGAVDHNGYLAEPPARDTFWQMQPNGTLADFLALPLPDDLFGDVFGGVAHSYSA